MRVPADISFYSHLRVATVADTPGQEAAGTAEAPGALPAAGGRGGASSVLLPGARALASLPQPGGRGTRWAPPPQRVPGAPAGETAGRGHRDHRALLPGTSVCPRHLGPRHSPLLRSARACRGDGARVTPGPLGTQAPAGPTPTVTTRVASPPHPLPTAPRRPSGRLQDPGPGPAPRHPLRPSLSPRRHQGRCSSALSPPGALLS